MAKYCFDIDGTICETTGSDYPNSVPNAERITQINLLFEQGHEVIFFTARGSTSGRNWRELTESQLAHWGVKYHELIMGKPSADLYIDDKGRSDVEFFSTLE
jgi:uncharacterized HAD superfamily protein